MNCTTLKGMSWISESDDATSARIDNGRMLGPAARAADGSAGAPAYVMSVNIVCRPRSGRPGARLVLSRMLVVSRDDGAAIPGNVVCTLNCSH